MNFIIKGFTGNDEESFIKLSCGLSEYNYYNRPKSERTYSLDERLKNRIETCKNKINDILESTSQHAFIALIDEKPVGYITVCKYSNNSGLIDELYIINNFRGYGIGKSLIEKASTWLKEVGANKMLIKVFKWNKTALTFYENEGFEKYIITYSRNLD